MFETPSQGRRRFLGATLCGALASCGGGDSDADAAQPAPGPVPDKQVNDAIAQLDKLAANLMTSSGLPGMAVAVVRVDQTVYAKGFGTRLVGSGTAVDADTVFQLASVSKSVGSCVVAQQVGTGSVAWNTTVRAHLPWFTLSDAEVSQEVTVADLYSHQSGLPDHAGDRLEDLGYSQTEVLQRLRYLPLHPFRNSYFYTNFGLTAAAVSVARGRGHRLGDALRARALSAARHEQHQFALRGFRRAQQSRAGPRQVEREMGAAESVRCRMRSRRRAASVRRSTTWRSGSR